MELSCYNYTTLHMFSSSLFMKIHIHCTLQLGYFPPLFSVGYEWESFRYLKYLPDGSVPGDSMSSNISTLCLKSPSKRRFLDFSEEARLGVPVSSSPFLEAIVLTMSSYTGWPRKNGTAYFPQYMDAITGISVWGNLSWDKLIPRSSILVQ